MPFPFPIIPGNNNVSFPGIPEIGNEIFIPVPVPESWECNLSFPFPFPKFGNGLSHSRSQMSKSHSRSPLQGKWLGGRKYMRQLSCTNRHIGKTPFFLWQFGDCWNFPRDISIIQNWSAKMHFGSLDQSCWKSWFWMALVMIYAVLLHFDFVAKFTVKMWIRIS